MERFTKSEAAAIDAAWRAVANVCACTNWSDGPAWRDAERAERKQAGGDFPQKTTWARAMICKAWAEGFDNPDRPARELFWIRPGYLGAFLLGVRHKTERAGDSYTGPKVAEARELCGAAIAANDAHTARILGSK